MSHDNMFYLFFFFLSWLFIISIYPLHECHVLYDYQTINIDNCIVYPSSIYSFLYITSLVSTNLSYIIINDLFQSNIAFQPRSYGMQSWNLIAHKWSFSIIKLR